MPAIVAARSAAAFVEGGVSCAGELRWGDMEVSTATPSPPSPPKSLALRTRAGRTIGSGRFERRSVEVARGGGRAHGDAGMVPCSPSVSAVGGFAALASAMPTAAPSWPLESILSEVVSTRLIVALEASMRARPSAGVSSSICVMDSCFETREARIGVSRPSRSSRPLAKAAAVICTRPSSEE